MERHLKSAANETNIDKEKKIKKEKIKNNKKRTDKIKIDI